MLDPVYQMRKFDRAMMRHENRMDRDMMKQQFKMDKMARKELQRQYKMDEKISGFIHVEKTKDDYKIIIDLKPFDNNEKNVEISTSGNILSINAAGEKNTKNKTEVLKYNQNFTFGDDVDLNNISKVREGNKYIITVPIEE